MHPLHPITVCYFQGIPGRFRREPSPPDDGNNGPQHPPLTAREKIVYSLLAGWGCLTFLMLLILVIVTHSPLIAN